LNNSSPSLKEWRALYEAAIKFKEIRSWNWMTDVDIFGVKNPENGEIGYCVILGSSGQIINHHLSSHSEYKTDFQRGFLNLIERIKIIPKVVLVRKKEALQLLEPAAQKLDIEVKLVKEFIALDEALHAMIQYFQLYWKIFTHLSNTLFLYRLILSIDRVLIFLM